LVKLSPNELATDEQKDARDAESKASTLERRADYYQIARAGIQVRGKILHMLVTIFFILSSYSTPRIFSNFLSAIDPALFINVHLIY
jgi:hypothetical protein